MIAKVISGKDIKGAINYNEEKVKAGKANCIQTNLFKGNGPALSFHAKLSRFTDLNERNKRTKTNTLHISLNFDPSEKLDEDTLNRIASTYMDRIGFGDQPYLVYEHKDAAHQHVHIVSTLIREDGSRIPIHYLGKNESEKARKEIEIEFALVKADTKKHAEAQIILPIDVEKAIYGKSLTRQSISNIVRMVTRSYKYTSLHELNAILRQFNVTADRGTERSMMYEKKGLIYSLMDESGKRIGIPVKSSSIYTKPTLAFLEKQFKLNEALRQPFREPLKKIIVKVLLSPGIRNREQFAAAMKNTDTTVVFRTNTEARTYGITFVDHQNRVVFNGSALGKSYSANAILALLSEKEDTVTPVKPKISIEKRPATTTIPRQQKIQTDLSLKEAHIQSTSNSHKAASDHGFGKVLSNLITADSFDPTSPDAALMLGRKRRRKRKGRKL